VYRAVDEYGQVIDVLVSMRRDGDAARRFFQQALTTLKVTPSEVVTAAAVLEGLRTDRTAAIVIAGHAFGQNLRRGHY
jgi:transposase-like protein